MSSETIKVLLIDDDEEDYILTRELLAEVKVGNYALDWASSYEEGLQVVARREHHVCLVDYRLGARSGVQLIREAWAARLTTPMILLTGHGSHDVDVEAMQAGATDYLIKDQTPTALLERTLRYAVELNTERCRAEEALGAYAQKQVVVAEIGRMALAGGDLNDLFAAAVSLVAGTLNVDYCKVLELLPDGEALILRAGVGWKDDYLNGEVTFSAGKESQAGFTLLSNEPVVVENLRTETRFIGTPMLHEHGVVSGMSVIIRGRERPYGVLATHTASVRRFAPDDVNFLLAVANVLGEAIGRKSAENEKAQLTRHIEQQSRRLNNIVATVPGVVWEAWGEPDAASQRMNFVSDYVETMLGYSVEEWLQTPNFWLSIVHPDDRERTARAAAADFAAGKGSNTLEFRWVAKDGRILWVESKSAIILDDEGQPVGSRGVTLDITERKKLEEQLHQAQKMEAIGTLAGGIAHDFNNILGAIIGHSELAQSDLAPDSIAQVHLEQVLKASTRAGDLVRQILTFSRQEDLEREPLQLQPVIDETLKLLRASLPSTIEIRRHIDTAAPAVMGDGTQMQQVIMNLCANAGQSMDDRGGTLDIRLARFDIDHDFAIAHPQLKEGPHVLLEISDSGGGMDLATQKRIFEPFFTTKAPGEGTGLGLAVVHGVVKNHGGAIVVSSELGGGSTFSVYLPVYDRQPVAKIQKSNPVPQGNGEHILFIDDEEALVSVGKSMLEHLGYRVTSTTDSVEALAAFRSQPGAFDVVITDQTMPHLNGADLARELLQIRPTLPVILATGFTSTMTPEKCKAMGIRELLLKPNTMQLLGEAIHRALTTS